MVEITPTRSAFSASTSPQGGGGKRVCFKLLLALILVGCGQQAAKAPQPAEQTGSTQLPGQAAPIRTIDLAIPAKFDEAGMFDGGLAPVRVGGKFGYTNRTGEMVIAPQFDFAGRFAEGLAAAGIGSKEGYIDKSGKFVLLPQFEVADLSVFSEGLAAVKLASSSPANGAISTRRGTW